MYEQGIKGHSSRSSRSMDFFLNLVHIIVGIMIVILAVLSFLNAENNLVLFPVIFILAAVLNLVNGWVKIRRRGRDKKKLLAGAGLLLFGSALVLLAVVSAFSIWR